MHKISQDAIVLFRALGGQAFACDRLDKANIYMVEASTIALSVAVVDRSLLIQDNATDAVYPQL